MGRPPVLFLMVEGTKQILGWAAEPTKAAHAGGQGQGHCTCANVVGMAATVGVVGGRVQVRGSLKALDCEGQIVLVPIPKGGDVARQPHAAAARICNDFLFRLAVAKHRDVGGQREGSPGGHRSGGLRRGGVGRDVTLALFGCNRIESHQRSSGVILWACIPVAHEMQLLSDSCSRHFT